MLGGGAFGGFGGRLRPGAANMRKNSTWSVVTTWLWYMQISGFLATSICSPGRGLYALAAGLLAFNIAWIAARALFLLLRRRRRGQRVSPSE